MAEDHYYLTVSREKKWNKDHTLYGYIAIISLGQPQFGDEQCTVCDVEIVDNMRSARQWYKRMMVEKPWEPRQ